MTGSRLPAPAGRYIDRGRAIEFQFNGKRYSGFAGDTLASALIANGVRLVGRSFKLHRPRGIFSCGIEEPSGLVDVGSGAGRIPNLRATLVPLHQGLRAESVNCWPSVGFDVGAINNLLSAVLPAGFYYKTFKWPDWHLFEPTIRRMAGLGRASGMPDPDRYEEIAARADVLVVGGGVAGMSAALAAAQAGADTLLIAAGTQLGGAAGWREDAEVTALLARVRQAGIRVLSNTLAFGVYDHNLLCAAQRLPGHLQSTPGGRLRERVWKIRARNIVAACGAFERPMVLPNNDRPGVMLAGAVDKYAAAFGVACGRRAVIAANSDAAYPIAASLKAAGVQISAIIDIRTRKDIHTSSGDIRALSDARITLVEGGRSVQGCRISSATQSGERLDCDLILNAGGFAPAVHLHSQAGGRLRWLDDGAMFVPDGAAPGLFSVGACAGVFGRDAAMAHASEVGAALARGTAVPAAPVSGAGRSIASTHLPQSKGKQFIDLQNDVATSDVALAARENYASVEHLKRYTTTGMGTDQGKTSNINALVLMAEQTGRAPPEVGTTKFRPPFAPVSFGMLVGRRTGALYRPMKRLPAYDWHVARGALFEDFGSWRRPAAYPVGAETLTAAAQREAGVVRTAAGILDGSPLGKLEVYGPDAAQFLDLMYLGTMSTLAIGQARYGLLLNENGILIDDGIVARLDEQRFWVNTTSAGVERAAAAFEEWLQCEYTNFKVLVTPVSSRWGEVTVAGPRAWEWLSAVGFDSALSPAAMKHMTMRDSELDGIPLRVLRASFSGELGYEINLAVDETRGLLDRLWARAPEFGAVPYGIEALEILRVEKGFIHIGSDTDGTTLPGDVGFGRAVDRKSAEFVGRRSLLRAAARDPDRFTLVGLVPVDRRTLLPTGAQIAPEPPPTLTQGHVTSSHHSPALGHPIALAMLARGAQRLGERVRVHHLGAAIEAEVVKSTFYDPTGARLNG